MTWSAFGVLAIALVVVGLDIADALAAAGVVAFAVWCLT